MWSNPKQPIFRSEPLRRAVASLHCVCCGIHGWTQCAHIGGLKEGKGRSLKVSDSRVAALCGPHPSPMGPAYPYVPGCHADLDQGRIDSARGPEFVAETYVLLMEQRKLRVAG
ncbi:MAG TPA: hypothetical protein VMQ17_13615 [Candidatus Sulfotelmatobacter sp.]|nr:hypothetical protein [Candidatus Sulfotelmatobacter sp.]